MRSLHALLLICGFFLVASCKKDYSESIVTLNSANAGATILVSKGATIILTLPNEGSDDGYLINAPQCDTTILKLTSHVYTPAAGGATGATGTDTWQFATLKDGATFLTISETKAASTITEFMSTINVK